MRFPKNMGMPPNHLVVDFADYIRNRKTPPLLRDLRMKYDLQEKISHFFREFGVVPALQRFQDFVRLLNQIGSQRFVSLFAIPRTAARCAKPSLHSNELFKPFAGSRLRPLYRFSPAAPRILSVLYLLFAGARHVSEYFPLSSSVPLYGDAGPLTSSPPEPAKCGSDQSYNRDKLNSNNIVKECPLSEKKQEESFRVIDRRPFTSEGELRKEVVEEAEREAKREAAMRPLAPAEPATAPVAAPPAELPTRIPAFESLVRMLGSNAAMVLGAYADPRSGQPMIDPEAARELIDMLDALHEKTKGNLAPEEDTLLMDLLGKLKMTFLEVNQAIAAQAAQVKAKARP
jgi:uncharacterized protein DUF1844